MKSSTTEIKIQISLNEWQKTVLRNEKRFTVISAGRQCGKTFYCVFRIVAKAFENARSVNWWVAPTYDPSRMAFRRVIDFLISNDIPCDYNKSELRITLFNGSVIQFKSADREEGLRGETVNFMVIDEMGLIKRDVWEFALRGTITATQANVIFIGTPKGKNLFFELWMKGQDARQKEYVSFQYSSNASKYFPDAEWQQVKSLPMRIFQQEYEARFLDDGGEVFRNIRDCIRGQYEEPTDRRTFYAGVDLAKSSDYSVICILNDKGHLVHFERFNDIAYTIQKERITRTVGRYRAHTYIDSTGVGDPIFDDLSLSDLAINSFKFTNISKRQIIEALSMAIERAEISFPEEPDLINELSTFTFEQLPSGMIRYNAPSGLHDDCVIALALAYHSYAGNRHAKGDFTGMGRRISQDFA